MGGGDPAEPGAHRDDAVLPVGADAQDVADLGVGLLVAGDVADEVEEVGRAGGDGDGGFSVNHECSPASR